MKRALSILAAAAVFIAFEAIAGDDHGHKHEKAAKDEATEVKPQTTCPLTGKELADKELFADHEGKRVYFCSPECRAPFLEDPEKYIKKLEDEGVTLAKLQTKCPVMTKNNINKKLFADYEGKRVYFCCPGCKPTFLKDPGKYIKKIEAEGVTLEKTPEKE